MKWVKLGRIFDPTKFKLPNNCFEFAQSPQTLLFDDFIRIYFSTRQRDKNDKYLSHIAFVDFDKNFKNIINISTNTVIELGKLGCYDEHGIFPFNILKDKDKISGYIGGWSRRVSVSIETSIGLALSDDMGLTFRRIGDGPVLTSSLNEPFLVGDPFVAIFDNIFHMWYIYGNKWLKKAKNDTPERVYKIGHATSENGISWAKTNKQIIIDKLNSDECQALPSVIKYFNTFHMVFCYRHATDFRKKKQRGYRIGYAYSEDLSCWIRDDNNVGIDVSQDGWDSEMLCYPHIFQSDGNVFMLYNGNEFGRYGFGIAVLDN
jgi:hypothetical protein